MPDNHDLKPFITVAFGVLVCGFGTAIMFCPSRNGRCFTCLALGCFDLLCLSNAVIAVNSLSQQSQCVLNGGILQLTKDCCVAIFFIDQLSHLGIVQSQLCKHVVSGNAVTNISAVNFTFVFISGQSQHVYHGGLRRKRKGKTALF